MGKFVQKPVIRWVLEGSPVPVETRILEIIVDRGDKNPFTPTELMDFMYEHIPPYESRDVQQGLWNLLKGGEIDFANNRKIILKK